MLTILVLVMLSKVIRIVMIVAVMIVAVMMNMSWHKIYHSSVIIKTTIFLAFEHSLIYLTNLNVWRSYRN